MHIYINLLYYFSPLGGKAANVHVRTQMVNRASHWYIWGALAIVRTSQHEKVTGRSHWVFSGQALRSSELRDCGLPSSKGHVSFQCFDASPSTRVPLVWNRIKAEQKAFLIELKMLCIFHTFQERMDRNYIYGDKRQCLLGFCMLYKFLLATEMHSVVQF